MNTLVSKEENITKTNPQNYYRNVGHNDFKLLALLSSVKTHVAENVYIVPCHLDAMITFNLIVHHNSKI